MASEAQKRAKKKYNRLHVHRFQMELNKRTDADIIERLNAVGNKQGYVKRLIREDIKK